MPPLTPPLGVEAGAVTVMLPIGEVHVGAVDTFAEGVI